MSRIRTVKPEFFSDEKLARLSRDSRLFFIGLWTVCCDDYGVSRAHPGFLRQVFPYDDLSTKEISSLVDELEAGGFISRFEAQGEQYLYVWSWERHQKVDHRSKFRNPSPPENLARTSREPRDTLAPYLVPGPSTWTGTKDQDQTPAAPAARGQADELFEHWVKKLARPPQCRLTPKLRTKINAALKTYPLDTLKLAVEGMGNDPWPDRKLHLGLEYALRDVEKFVALAPGAPDLNDVTKGVGRPSDWSGEDTFTSPELRHIHGQH